MIANTHSAKRKANALDGRRAVQPTLCVVGPLIGRNPGHTLTQGEAVVDLLSGAGYPTCAASCHRNRFVRTVDIVKVLYSCRRAIDILLLQVYGGPRSFLVEDLASAMGKVFGHRVVMHVRGGAMPDFMRRYPRWTRRVMSRADLIIAPSRYLARVTEEQGYPTRVIPNVINLELYPFRPRTRLRPKLLWMRTFEDTYNPHMALEVLGHLRSRVPDATLVMAGQDLGMLQSTKKKAESMRLGHAVRFAGFLSSEDKVRESAEADIFLNTNRVDNTPVSVIEAGALGMPVVSTSVGGIPYLLTHRRTGLLVPNDDARAMADAVLELLGDVPLSTDLSRNGRQLAEECSSERVLRLWNEVMSDLPQAS